MTTTCTNILSRFQSKISETLHQQSGYLPGTYVAYLPNVCFKDGSFPPPTAEISISANWCAQYSEVKEKVEKIDRNSGYSENRASRLCKVAIFTIYRRVLKARRLGNETTDLNYKTAKEYAKDYQQVGLANLLSRGDFLMVFSWSPGFFFKNPEISAITMKNSRDPEKNLDTYFVFTNP